MAVCGLTSLLALHIFIHNIYSSLLLWSRYFTVALFCGLNIHHHSHGQPLIVKHRSVSKVLVYHINNFNIKRTLKI